MSLMAGVHDAIPGKCHRQVRGLNLFGLLSANATAASQGFLTAGLWRRRCMLPMPPWGRHKRGFRTQKAPGTVARHLWVSARRPPAERRG